MSEFSGFFVREWLGQTPATYPSAWCESPDIIFNGTQPAADPAQFLTPSGYATDYGTTVYAQIPPVANFVYLRAMNTSPDATASTPLTGRAWFYWTESDLALWPQNWSSALVTVAGESVNYQPITTNADNQVVMPDLPYLWSPPPPQPNSHYCCISYMEYPPSEPPQNPVSTFGYFQSWDDLNNFVLAHPNMGWRNTTDVRGQITWELTSGITGPAVPGMFWVGVQCVNMPTDAQLGYFIPGPNPDIPPVISPLAAITNPDMYNSIPILNWPGGARSSITVQYVQGATTPPEGARVIIMLHVPTNSLSEETLALAMQHPERMRTIAPEEFLFEEHRTNADVLQITNVLVLGSHTCTF